MTLTLTPLREIPLIQPGDNLGEILFNAAQRTGLSWQDGDILVVAQKIVSKAEGRHVDLANVKPGARAIQLANETGKDARLVEVILSESNRVVRHRLGVLIVEHRLGFVLANAGVDQSNVNPATGSEPVYNKKTRGTVWMPTYSYVQASGTGAVQLTAQLTFAGCVSTYVWVDGFGWYFTGTSYPDYSIVVDRKQGSKYKPVLQGSFLSPAAPPPQ